MTAHALGHAGEIFTAAGLDCSPRFGRGQGGLGSKRVRARNDAMSSQRDRTTMQRSSFPGLLAWLAAIGVHVGVAYAVAPIF
jgi:hypothetical protein